MEMFLIIVRENLFLKLLLQKDALDFFRLMEKNRKYLSRFMPRINDTKNVEDTVRVVELFLKQLSENDGFKAGIYMNENLIGIAGLKYLDWLNSKTEIMYWIDEDYSYKGITTDCVKKLIDIAFTYYGLNKVIIRMSVENLGSIRVAEKCGLQFEGINRQDEACGTGLTDIRVYSILKAEYENRKIK